MSDATQSDSGIKAYAEFVRMELDAERERRSRLGQRGLAVFTSSVALTTLLLGVGALLVGKDAVAADGWTTSAVVMTLLALSASAMLVLVRVASLPTYPVVDEPGLKKLRDEAGGKTDDETRRIIAGLQRHTLVSLRDVNQAKASALLWSLRLQLLGMLCLSASVVLLVARG